MERLLRQAGDNRMKTISVVVPAFNERDNIAALYERTSAVMRALSSYDYEFIFLDDGSTDGTRDIIEDLCARDPKVRAVFSARNFGYSRTIFYGMLLAQGDCAVLLHADLQNPPELIPQFVAQWENGCQVVLGVKKGSKENRLLYFCRKCYYALMKHISDFDHVSQATDFELLDRSFLEILRSVRMRTPYLRGLIMEYAHSIGRVEYTQERRLKGKSHFNFYRYYDFAMLGITSTSKKLLRPATLFGAFFALAAVLFAFIAVIAQLIVRGDVSVLITRLLILLLLFAAGVQTFFIGLLGEYVLALIGNAADKPIVVEKLRINFHDHQ